MCTLKPLHPSTLFIHAISNSESLLQLSSHQKAKQLLIVVLYFLRLLNPKVQKIEVLVHIKIIKEFIAVRGAAKTEAQGI